MRLGKILKHGQYLEVTVAGDSTVLKLDECLSCLATVREVYMFNQWYTVKFNRKKKKFARNLKVSKNF